MLHPHLPLHCEAGRKICLRVMKCNLQCFTEGLLKRKWKWVFYWVLMGWPYMLTAVSLRSVSVMKYWKPGHLLQRKGTYLAQYGVQDQVVSSSSSQWGRAPFLGNSRLCGPPFGHSSCLSHRKKIYCTDRGACSQHQQSHGVNSYFMKLPQHKCNWEYRLPQPSFNTSIIPPPKGALKPFAVNQIIDPDNHSSVVSINLHFPDSYKRNRKMRSFFFGIFHLVYLLDLFTCSIYQNLVFKLYHSSVWIYCILLT